MLCVLLHAYYNKNIFFCSDLESFDNVGIAHYCLNDFSKAAVFQMSLLSNMLIELLVDAIIIMIVKIQ